MTSRSNNATGPNIKNGLGLLSWPVATLLSRLPQRCLAGRLTIRFPTGLDFECVSDKPGPHARIDLRRWRGLSRSLFGGSVGFAQAYMDADCDCADLGRLFEWALANEPVLGALGAASPVSRWLRRRHHRSNANTLQGSRRNIASHYDLGNDFYAAWLDAGMTYSSAMYCDRADMSLEAAQDVKLDRVVKLLELNGGERVLEIGCGWGALAERIATGPAANFTGLTLSQRQLDFTAERLDKAGVTEGADIRLQDYREVEGTFDRIVSIEMLEAVGQSYWPVYFSTLRDRLAPGGSAVVQIITIRDERFAEYLREPDFIQRYIFPGGMLPTKAILREQIVAASLRMDCMETFGACYARTLCEWRSRFLAGWPRLAEMGFDERFRRMWTYYLTYCEAGFLAGELDVGLYRIVRSDS